MPWVYILRCGDNTFYVGHTRDLGTRLHDHRCGDGAHHTAVRLPIDLVYTESFPTIDAAIERERQLKRWSAEKKAALISGDLTTLQGLSKRRRPKS
jgi:predicted GIY-YIG superfamily endonuclease